MKINNFIKLAVAVLSFFVITNASALTTTEQNIYDDFVTNRFDSNYSYCIWYSSSTSRTYIDCFSSEPYIDSSYPCMDSPINIKSSGYYASGNYVRTDILDSCSARTMSLDIYLNFDLYDSEHSNILYNKNINFGSSVEIYTITFNPPKNTTIVVKDSNGVEVTATSQYIYNLSSGTYTYSASNSLYTSLTDIEFTVLENETIDVNMQEKLQSQPMKSIFTQYYNYISDLVGKVFDIENPMLLFFVSFIIGFSLIILMKKLIGGIF